MPYARKFAQIQKIAHAPLSFIVVDEELDRKHHFFIIIIIIVEFVRNDHTDTETNHITSDRTT